MNVTEKLGLIKRLKDVKTQIVESVLNMAARLQLTKELAEIKLKLSVKSDKTLPENNTPAQWGKMANDWLKKHLQGKSIIASNGAKIFFNRNLSIDHLAHDARRSQLAAQSIQFVADVFETGEYQGAEPLSKSRKDNIVAFHAYEKWVQLDSGMRVYLRAKAAEFSDGRFEAYGDTIAYTQRILDIENRKRLPSNPTMDNAFGGLVSDAQNDNALLTILQVLDPQGNDVTLNYSEAATSGSLNTPSDALDVPELVLPENASRHDLGKTVNQWLKDNLQGKVIIASNGAKIRFNSAQSVKHLIHDGRRGKLAAKSIGHITEVFKTGTYIGRENLYKERSDFVAFHTYQKWVEIDGYQLHLEAKAGEKENGELETLPELIAYTQKIKEKVALSAFQSIEAENSQAGNFKIKTTEHDDTATFDKAQIIVENQATLTILQILDSQGNDVTPNYSEETSGSLKTAQLYVFDETKTKTQRQYDNNAVFALLDKVDSGEISPENITPEQKAVLAKYSGSGGGLKARDGKTGSAHEYYTPAPVAAAMWQAVEEMGFSGGKVLDPCGGSGIFGAFAPQNAIVQAVEMDETSAQVNQLVNGSDRYHVDVASFEEKAQSIPDHSVDAIVTNVPFGDVSLRKHRNKDSKFQKENLQTYFVLRSLDKLKHGGLAAFIVPSSFLDSKGGKATNARVLTSQVAEFIGAYRLPNSVFGTAAADVATDVIFYRKYSPELTKKIAELQAQNPEVLKTSNVMWTPYLDGQYFKLPENKKFIFGKESEVESWRTDKDGNKKKVYAVLNNDSVANIASAIKRFSGSRIDWNMLETTQTQPITYNQGDTIYQNGQAYVFDGVKFEAVAASENEAESMANDILAKLDTPLSAFENKVTAKQAMQTAEYLTRTAQHGAMPSWAVGLIRDLPKVTENKREQQFKRVVVGLSVQYVMDNFSGRDQTQDHADLSDAMKARISLDNGLNAFRKSVQAINLHYDRKTGFSAAWKGESAVLDTPELTTEKKVEQIQYLNGTLALPSEKVRELGINPLENDDWCINADGTEAMKADDYFSGSLKDCLDKIDADIQAAKTPEIRAKLEKMRQMAFNRSPAVDVGKMRFDVRSQFVDQALISRFLEQKIAAMSSKGETGANRGVSRMKLYREQNPNNGKFYLTINGSTNTDNDRLLKRIGNYLETGNITLQNTQFDHFTDQEALAKIREIINDWNSELDTWLKADDEFMNNLRAKAQNPENRRFAAVDDGSPLTIQGESGEFSLHDYQNAFIRKQAREFGGINSFGVGLGKTVTALATAQYALETGTKKKVCFIVPNAVLSNWAKESSKYFKQPEKENCLFIGADVDKNGDFVVNSKNYARDLNRVLENKHNKIFMTQQAFEKIRLREETAQEYVEYLASVDSSFAEKQNAAKNEKAQAKGANLLDTILSGEKLTNAPFFEDLGIDALVIDEAHHYKNAKQAIKNNRVKGISAGSQSNRAIDMNVKTWFLRGKNQPRKDGVLLLTATPVTNSPLEIYSMMSLAVGEERGNQAMLGGIDGSDGFINAICEISYRDDQNITGEEVSIQSLVGIKNLTLVQSLIQNTADVKEAADVGKSFKQVESEMLSDGVQLDAQTKAELAKYKAAYRIARMKQANKDIVIGVTVNEIEYRAYQDMLDSGITNELLANPFSMITRMSKALLDLELNTGTVTYFVEDEKSAQKVVDEFNQKSKTFKTNDMPTNFDSVVSQKVKKSNDGFDDDIEYTVKASAKLEDGKIVLNCDVFEIQMQLENMLDAANVHIGNKISPKVAALLENVKKEQAHIRYKDASGSLKNKFAKQIIFVESLAMHTKIKRAIVQNCGIPASKITFISGKFNSDPDEIIDVQERFNSDDEENGYVIVIANKKAEVGINLQKGCQAIHHLELNWTPDSITQRNGRGIRQGNTAEKVNVYFYEADGTFDTYRRTTIDRKSNWIESVMSKAENESGYAEIGQGETKEEIDELINFDGSAAEFEALLKKQAKRKQDALDRMAVKSQAVSVGIMKSANEWLRNNATPRDYLIQEIEKMLKDFSAFEVAKKNHDKNDSKKNEFAFKQASLKMEVWAERFSGLETERKSNYDRYRGVYLNVENAPIIEKITAQNGMVDFKLVKTHIWDYRNDENFMLPENHREYTIWQNETDKQTRLRENAGKSAKNAVGLDGAVSLEEIEILQKGELYLVHHGKFIQNKTVAKMPDGTICILKMNNHNDYKVFEYYPREKINRNSAGGYNHDLNHFSEEENIIITPDDANYSDIFKELAERETLLIRQFIKRKEYGSHEPYRWVGYAPSKEFDEVVDYLPDDIQKIRVGNHQ